MGVWRVNVLSVWGWRVNVLSVGEGVGGWRVDVLSVGGGELTFFLCVCVGGWGGS